MKYKRVYGVWLQTTYTIGMQPVKGNNKKQARQRFKKRFPEARILDCQRLHVNPLTKPI